MVALSTLLLLCFSVTTLIQLFCIVWISISARSLHQILDARLAEAIKAAIKELQEDFTAGSGGVEAPNPAVMFLLDLMKKNMEKRNTQGQFEKVIEIVKSDS